MLIQSLDENSSLIHCGILFAFDTEVILCGYWSVPNKHALTCSIVFEFKSLFCYLLELFEEIRKRFVLVVMFELISLVSRYFLEVISRVFFTEHLEDLPEWYVGMSGVTRIVCKNSMASSRRRLVKNWSLSSCVIFCRKRRIWFKSKCSNLL